MRLADSGFAKPTFAITIAFAILVFWLAVPGWALADTLSGPRSVDETLKGGDALISPQYRSWHFSDAFRPWYDFKAGLQQKHNTDFGFDYSVLGQTSTSDLGRRGAVGHDLRFFGTWTPINPGGPNAGSLTVKFENRLGYTSIPPQDLGFNWGAASITAAQFSDAGWILTNLYWRQRLFDDRFTFGFGQIDVTDFMDVYALANPLTGFSNLVFSISPAIPAPNQGLGVAAGVWLSNHIYATASLSDANGDPRIPIQSANRFFETGERFHHFEIGYSSSRDRQFLDNVHLTVWHVDPRVMAGLPEGWGTSMSASWAIDNTWMPFLRAGFAEKGGALYDRTISVGIGYLTRQRDLIGVGLNWAHPQGASGNQGTVEAFYRYQVSKEFAVTFDAQLIVNPALNPNKNMIGIFGVRTRLAF